MIIFVTHSNENVFLITYKMPMIFAYRISIKRVKPSFTIKMDINIYLQQIQRYYPHLTQKLLDNNTV